MASLSSPCATGRIQSPLTQDRGRGRSVRAGRPWGLGLGAGGTGWRQEFPSLPAALMGGLGVVSPGPRFLLFNVS